MRFRGKAYGESYVQQCAFCGSIATQKNDAGVYVCHRHKQQRLEEVKCSCGSWLEQRAGKFGPYFNCLKCGNINFKKGMELKALQKSAQVVSSIKKQELFQEEKKVTACGKKEPKEIIISTNDVEYFE